MDFNKNYLIFLAVFILFFSIAFYTYYYYIKPRIDKIYVPNKEFINKEVSDVAELYYFYTEWCPHCKQARPVLEQLQKYLKSKNNIINNVEVLVHLIDCEKQTDLADSFNVNNYPTIKISYKDNIIEYDAKPEIDHLLEFIESTTS
jgi:thiol-disulfide isomerase/thioredoxin